MTILTCGMHDPEAGLRWISKDHIPALLSMFDQVLITASPATDQNYLDELSRQGCHIHKRKTNNISLVYFTAIKQGLMTGAEHILYCDFDRVLHWIRTYPRELARVTRRLDDIDYLIGMRGPREYQSHHEALYYTERLANIIISREMSEGVYRDYLSGCYGFSARAATYIVKHMRKTSLSLYGHWPLIMKTHGFEPSYLTCKGLEWETPDQHQDDVARCGGVEAYRDWLSSSQEWKRRAVMALEFVKEITLK